MAGRDETRRSSCNARFVHVLLTLIVLQVFAVGAGSVDYGHRRRRSAFGGGGVVLHWRERRTPAAVREGPPVKPDHFRSVAELNKYLDELNEYYTVLGRPRFGKRDVEISDEFDDSLLSDATGLARARYRRDTDRRRRQHRHPQQQQHNRSDNA